jgi:ArsR family transcriptional regulator
MPQLAELFRALADTNRLRIMNILSRQSLCVCDLQSVLDLHQPFISRHLAHLRKVGLVRSARDGPRVCYSLALGTPFGYALQSFLRDTLPLSSELQGDLRRLAQFGTTRHLKSAAGGLEQLRSQAA